MERNALLAPRIRVIPNAVADKDGEMTFVVSEEMKGESTGSHLATALPPLRAAVYANFKKQAVSTVTLDTLIQQQGERPPDVIKLDVEGAEHLVIRGGRTLLARYRPLLLVEVHHICAMFELALMLWELGYTLEIIERERAEPSRCFVCAFHP
jgi:FkbM family methyltransferase